MASAAKRYGAGASASPLITGYTEIHQLLEERLAAFTGRDRALVFSAGYLTNLGTVQALAERGDTLIEDRLNHASLLDAARLSRARCLRYRHADAADAARLLQEHQARLILTDGVFSMDGDTAPVTELAAAAHAHDALLLCDDAHGIGVLGTHGGGLLEEARLSQVEVPLLVGTLGKALGAQGGFVAGPADLRRRTRRPDRASPPVRRSYGYSTALPPPPLAAAADQLKGLLPDEPEPRAYAHSSDPRRHIGDSSNDSRQHSHDPLLCLSPCAGTNAVWHRGGKPLCLELGHSKKGKGEKPLHTWIELSPKFTNEWCQVLTC